MDEFEPHIHSFIIKLWLEETVKESGQILWRGHVTHVPSGERCYLKDLEEVVAFINSYLEEMGARITDQQGGQLERS